MFSDAFQDLLPVLDKTAAQRDRAGGHAAAEKALLRDADLLRLAIPTRFGGHGLPWPDVYRYVRALAKVDSAMAHVFAFHHLQVATVLIYGRPAQQAHWLPRTVEERGGAMRSTRATHASRPCPQQMAMCWTAAKVFAPAHVAPAI